MKIHSDGIGVRAPFTLLLLAAFSSAAVAGEVYKCKGSKGETIYQNLPCPEGSKPLAHGSYEPTPDNPTQMRDAEAESNRIHEQQWMQQRAADQQGQVATASSGGGSGSVGAAAGFQCSVNGKTWVQAAPCPATSQHYKSVSVNGNTIDGTSVHGTGTIAETVPVEQQTLSRDALCTKLQSDPAVSERGKSTPSSGYDRNKLRGANGC